MNWTKPEISRRIEKYGTERVELYWTNAKL